MTFVSKLKRIFFLVFFVLFSCPIKEGHLLTHDVYVWQQNWSKDLKNAILEAPTEINNFRVLIGNVLKNKSEINFVGVDFSPFLEKKKSLILVLRIEPQAKLDEITLLPLLERIEILNKRGISISGLEIDFDCPTNKLGNYIDWITREKLLIKKILTLSITSLPDWVNSELLPKLISTVDQVILQLHSIEGEQTFNPILAKKYIKKWIEKTKKRFFIALPTYHFRKYDGEYLFSDAKEIQKFLNENEVKNNNYIERVIWYRLGNIQDRLCWSTDTLMAVIKNIPLSSNIEIKILKRGEKLNDIEVKNWGNIDALSPKYIFIQGKIEACDGIMGYYCENNTLININSLILKPNESVSIGWVRGSEVKNEI